MARKRMPPKRMPRQRLSQEEDQLITSFIYLTGATFFVVGSFFFFFIATKQYGEAVHNYRQAKRRPGVRPPQQPIEEPPGI